MLAFHKHGMQGRSFKNNEVVQDILDASRIFKLLGSDRFESAAFMSKSDQDCLLNRVVVLESCPTDDPSSPSNLYILAGHENTQ